MKKVMASYFMDAQEIPMLYDYDFLGNFNEIFILLLESHNSFETSEVIIIIIIIIIICFVLYIF